MPTSFEKMDVMMEEDSFEGKDEFEIDLDYEFDAARFFDFSQAESLEEARHAELWFEAADSYPPSPYIAKLIMREDVENLNMTAEPKATAQRDSSSMHSDVGMGSDHSELNENYRGRTDNHHVNQDITKGKTTVIKASCSRVSTLMKPTASHLAKQNKPRDIKGSSRFAQRFHKHLEQRNERSLESSHANESQAPKRQKLEGGHLRKVLGIRQPTNLIHKISKKSQDGLFDGSRLKLTVPRAPELETLRRAQRIRPKHRTEVEARMLSAAPSFKARSLNKKILAAPSMLLPEKSTPRLPEFQEFHLKTSERALQHSSSASSLLQHSNISDKVSHNQKSLQQQNSIPAQPQKPAGTDELKQERSEALHKFKARPLNKKIFSSKGEMGIFRSSKRETTVTMEFNFQTDKRLQQDPPTELFSQLSLKSELQQNCAAESKLCQPTCTLAKGSKENIINSLQLEHKISHASPEKLPRHGGKPIQCGNNVGMTEVRSRANMCR